MMQTKTQIQQFYSGKTIFITGGSGLVGSFLIEKLLRSCSDISKIYVLMREKRGKDSKQRFTELTNAPVYDVLKKKNPSQLLKLFMLQGDLEAPMLGLSDEDLKIIITEVNCIFHVGANVRLPEELRSAVLINIRATQQLLMIARKVKALKSFVYISTMYFNSPRDVIDEVLYETDESAENVIQLVNSFDNEKLKKMTPVILGDWLYPYMYTKSLTEDLIRRTGHGLPIAVVRPSIIYPALKEPSPGLINSTPAVLALCSLTAGIAHGVYCDASSVVDLIPADYVVNNIIAVAWSTGTTCEMNEKSIQVYNCISSHQNPLTWGEYAQLVKKHDEILPSIKKMWHLFIVLTMNNVYISMLYWIQLPLMYLIDFYTFLLRKPQTAVKFYKHVHPVFSMAKYATGRKWIFKNHNTQRLWNKLEENDKKLFNFDAASFNWDTMFSKTFHGIRQHVLRESLDTIPKAQAKMRILKIAHYVIVFSFTLFICTTVLLLLHSFCL